MTLWPRIYEEHRKVILPLAIAAVVNLAILLLAVIPLGRSVEASRVAALDASTDLAAARLFERQVRNATTSKERADEQLQRFYADVLPVDFATARKTTNTWLQQAARASGLQYRSANFDWDEVRDSTLSKASSTVTLRGRYADIRDFLHAVETATEFLIVERVELAQSADTSAAGAGGALDVALVVSTFFVTGADAR